MRAHIWPAIGLAAVLLTGCEPMEPSRTTQPLPETAPGTPAPTPPDNTAVNERDASGATKTPIDQDENQADVERTAEIRKRILAAPEMSIYAREIKVITSQGKVTLRGPVNTEAERETIVRIATEVAGAGNVQDEIDVKPAQP